MTPYHITIIYKTDKGHTGLAAYVIQCREAAQAIALARLKLANNKSKRMATITRADVLEMRATK
jgi:hypothetical protein